VLVAVPSTSSTRAWDSLEAVACLIEHRCARVEADDRAAAPDDLRDLAQGDSGVAADIENGRAELDAEQLVRTEPRRRDRGGCHVEVARRRGANPGGVEVLPVLRGELIGHERAVVIQVAEAKVTPSALW
jgi:hypothetical protein